MVTELLGVSLTCRDVGQTPNRAPQILQGNAVLPMWPSGTSHHCSVLCTRHGEPCRVIALPCPIRECGRLIRHAGSHIIADVDGNKRVFCMVEV